MRDKQKPCKIYVFDNSPPTKCFDFHVHWWDWNSSGNREDLNSNQGLRQFSTTFRSAPRPLKFGRESTWSCCRCVPAASDRNGQLPGVSCKQPRLQTNKTTEKPAPAPFRGFPVECALGKTCRSELSQTKVWSTELFRPCSSLGSRTFHVECAACLQPLSAEEQPENAPGLGVEFQTSTPKLRVLGDQHVSSS